MNQAVASRPIAIERRISLCQALSEMSVVASGPLLNSPEHHPLCFLLAIAVNTTYTPYGWFEDWHRFLLAFGVNNAAIAFGRFRLRLLLAIAVNTTYTPNGCFAARLALAFGVNTAYTPYGFLAACLALAF